MNNTTTSRDSVNVDGHEVKISWDDNGANANISDLINIFPHYNEGEISQAAGVCNDFMNEKWAVSYEIAVKDGDGWKILESIRTINDLAANEYARQYYGDIKTVILKNGKNINEV